MSEDRFDPQKLRTECGKVDEGEYHVIADICKCKYDKKELRRKQINVIAIRSIEKWNNARLINVIGYLDIKELSDV